MENPIQSGCDAARKLQSMLFSFLIHPVTCITLATQEELAVAQVASFFAFSS